MSVFVERGYVNTDSLEALAQPPEFVLPQEQIDEVHAYGNNLLATPIGGEGSPTVLEVLRDALAERTEAPFFFAKPFIDGKVKGDDIPSFTSPAEVYDWLARQIQGGEDKEALRRLAQQSLIAYKKELAAEMLADKEVNEIDPNISEAKPFVVDPEGMIQRFGNLQTVRQMIRREYIGLKRGPSAADPVTQAKLAKLEVYLAKANGLVAEYYPCVGYAQDQAIRIGDREQWLHISEHVTPSVQLVIAWVNRKRFYTLLDYLKNGMGLDAEGKPSPVDARLWELANNPASTGEEGAPASRLTPEDAQKLHHYEVPGKEIKQIFMSVLESAGLLSQYDSEDPTHGYHASRRTPAADGKWQVAIAKTRDSLLVDQKARVMLVPGTQRSLYDVLVVGSHELEHVNQALAGLQIGRVDRMAELWGRGVGMLIECGANVVQRDTASALFGERSRGKPGMTYPAAIEELRAGKGPIAAAKSFYRGLCEARPDVPREKHASVAADRVVRLMLAEGSNSQPLAYAEEWLLNDQLERVSPEARARALGNITCFNLLDQARLHKFGLLPEVTRQEGKSLQQILLEVAQPLIGQALNRKIDVA